MGKVSNPDQQSISFEAGRVSYDRHSLRFASLHDPHSFKIDTGPNRHRKWWSEVCEVNDEVKNKQCKA